MEPKKSSGLAIASMVLGIVASCFSCCLYYISLPCAVISIIFSGVALSKIKAGTADGKGMAITGLVLGVISIVPAIIIIAVGNSLWAEFQSMV